MLCQNCGKNEATTHVKQIIHGDTAEQHLCADCARHLGYQDMFSGFGLSLSDMFGGFFGDALKTKNLAAAAPRCEKCGCSFEDIVREGRVGCADCYRRFYEKLQPSLQRIHGKVAHSGKTSRVAVKAEPSREEKIAAHKTRLQEAIAAENFELAAQLRDEIRAMEGEAS